MKRKWNKNSDIILTIEPHPDDGVYSAGGLLAKLQRYQKKLVSLCVFSKSHNAEVRQKENYRVWREHLKGEVIPLAFEETDLPEDITHFKNPKNQLQRFISVRKKITTLVAEINPKVVIFPFGIGQHMDHVIVNQIILQLCRGEERLLVMYEDYPYSEQFPLLYAEALFEMKRKINIRDVYINITNDIVKKNDMYMEYKSQHDYNNKQLSERLFSHGKNIRRELRTKVLVNPVGELYERYWIVENNSVKVHP